MHIRTRLHWCKTDVSYCFVKYVGNVLLLSRTATFLARLQNYGILLFVIWKRVDTKQKRSINEKKKTNFVALFKLFCFCFFPVLGLFMSQLLSRESWVCRMTIQEEKRPIRFSQNCSLFFFFPTGSLACCHRWKRTQQLLSSGRPLGAYGSCVALVSPVHRSGGRAKKKEHLEAKENAQCLYIRTTTARQEEEKREMMSEEALFKCLVVAWTIDNYLADSLGKHMYMAPLLVAAYLTLSGLFPFKSNITPTCLKDRYARRNR